MARSNTRNTCVCGSRKDPRAAMCRPCRRQLHRGPTAREKFLRILVTGSPTDCWEWPGGRDADGYGYVYRSRKDGGGRVRAHRLSFEVHKGPIPNGSVVRHKCDNPPCVNPDHLLAGSQADNVADAVVRDRLATGEGHPQTSLTEAQAWDLLVRAHSGEHQGRLAVEFGVCQGTVTNIKHGHTWPHLYRRWEERC